ncbi:hypothetical protein Tco_0783027, partial [Tanacetum coccineum]
MTKDSRVRLCGNVSQRQQKGGGDRRLYSESIPELHSAKMIIDAGSSDNIASTKNIEIEATESEVIKVTKVFDFDYELILKRIIKNPIKFSFVNKETIFVTIKNLVIVDKKYITQYGLIVGIWPSNRQECMSGNRKSLQCHSIQRALASWGGDG